MVDVPGGATAQPQLEPSFHVTKKSPCAHDRGLIQKAEAVDVERRFMATCAAQ